MESENVGYAVEYRPFGSLVWIGPISRVVADGFIPEAPHRFFIDADGQRFEIPFTNVEFRFSKERQLAVNEQAKAKAEAMKSENSTREHPS